MAEWSCIGICASAPTDQTIVSAIRNRMRSFIAVSDNGNPTIESRLRNCGTLPHPINGGSGASARSSFLRSTLGVAPPRFRRMSTPSVAAPFSAPVVELRLSVILL